MYQARSNLILGFHGCERKDQQDLLSSPYHFKKSQENYDWLGHGMYFWENNKDRAMEWAQMKKKSGTLKEPAVIGAVISLGYCLDLLDSSNINLLKSCYRLFVKESKELDKPIPVNKNHPSVKGNDKVLRHLDCAVIEYTHQFLKSKDEQKFDSVRAAYIEGEPIYEGAGFYNKTHIQVCIINPNCIKGFFLPRTFESSYPRV